MTPNVDFDVVVIGGGIVGLASAYKIALNHPDTRIAVFEKAEQLAAHQTGHNSGVIHSGLYYEPGSNKALTCTDGRKQLAEFAKEHGIEHRITGKIVVAAEDRELPELDRLLENGRANGIEGIEKIGADRIREIEPECRGIAAIRVPCTGIIDYKSVAEKLAELVRAGGKSNAVLTSHEVKAFEKHDFYTRILTNQGGFGAKHIINCAGLQSDRIALMDGVEPGARIVPFRGDYYRLTEEAAPKINAMIYPVPDPALPFLGVHLTRMIDGSVEAGPTAVFAFRREGYSKAAFSFRDTRDSLCYAGTWRLFLKHLKFGLGEYARAFFKAWFVRSLRKLAPSLSTADIVPARSGVRAQAVAPDGRLIDDFKIERTGSSIHVLNAPSPAATASLAIADHISRIAAEHFKLRKPQKIKPGPRKKAAARAKAHKTAKTKTRKSGQAKSGKSAKKATKPKKGEKPGAATQKPRPRKRKPRPGGGSKPAK